MSNQTHSQDSASDPRNEEDYDTWEYGTEPLPDDHTWGTPKVSTFDHLAFGDYDGYEETYKEAATVRFILMFGDYDGYEAYGDIPD